MGRGSISPDQLLYGSPTRRKAPKIEQGRPDVAELEAKVSRAEKLLLETEDELRQGLDQLRAVCVHQNVAETDYLPAGRFGGRAEVPLRICLDCGVEEEGWGSGYHILRAEPEEKNKGLARQDFYALRKGGRALWGWCHGNRDVPGHGVPVEELTHGKMGEGRGTRCSAEHTIEAAGASRAVRRRANAITLSGARS